MFFALSKILWEIVAPATALSLMLIAGAALLFTRFARAGRALVVLAAAGVVVLGFLPAGSILLRVLEDRFPPPPQDMVAPAGIVVLGGGVNQLVTHHRGPIELSEAGDRITEAVMLARRFPQAKVVFTGGSAALFGSPLREAFAAKRLFEGLGVPGQRLVFETESRNTYENAIFTRDLVKPQPGERWLLVTSAAHMPRSMGIFRKANFDVTAYPVDYVTPGLARDYWRPTMDVLSGLRRTDGAVREFIGLAAYRLTGKTDAFFPAP